MLSIYREPLGGHTLLLVALPIQKVVPTPFQRDISDAHVRKLTQAMDKTKRFLDPVVAVRDERVAKLADEDAPEARYWVPNGYHRLTALKELGAKTLLALLVPEPQVAYQILALNIEKAHNLREKALGVVRMYRDLLAAASEGSEIEPGTEEDRSLEFEEPALATLGFAYEERGRLSGGAYHPVLRKADTWIPRQAGEGAGRARVPGPGAAGLRRRRHREDRPAEGARLPEPLPAGLRGRPGEPAAVHEGRRPARRRAAGHHDQADQGHGRRPDQAAGRRPQRRGPGERRGVSSSRWVRVPMTSPRRYASPCGQGEGKHAVGTRDAIRLSEARNEVELRLDDPCSTLSPAAGRG